MARVLPQRVPPNNAHSQTADMQTYNVRWFRRDIDCVYVLFAYTFTNNIYWVALRTSPNPKAWAIAQDLHTYAIVKELTIIDGWRWFVIYVHRLSPTQLSDPSINMREANAHRTVPLAVQFNGLRSLAYTRNRFDLFIVFLESGVCPVVSQCRRYSAVRYTAACINCDLTQTFTCRSNAQPMLYHNTTTATTAMRKFCDATKPHLGIIQPHIHQQAIWIRDVNIVLSASTSASAAKPTKQPLPSTYYIPCQSLLDWIAAHFGLMNYSNSGSSTSKSSKCSENRFFRSVHVPGWWLSLCASVKTDNDDSDGDVSSRLAGRFSGHFACEHHRVCSAPNKDSR